MLQAHGITKRYPGVTALDAVELSIASGEVLGLVGENGAGKSTLIKVLGGLTAPDAGEIRVDDRPILMADVGTAARLGIAIIHQELNDVSNLDAAGNVLLGREPRRFGLIRRAELRRQAVVSLARLGIESLVDEPQANLAIGQRQLVEIAKALSQNARLLVMDEPTSSLTSGETDRLLRVVRDLRSQGVAVIYVSHRLNEVKALVDRVVVLRDGRNAGRLSRDEISMEAMVKMMVGRDVVRLPAREVTAHMDRLIVRNLRTRRYPGREVSFSIKAGEIVGLAGLVGAGRTEVARAICGIDPRVSGEVTLGGRAVPPSVRAAINTGLYLAPEDRRREGLITTMSVRENITLPALPDYASTGWIRRDGECATAERMRKFLGIRSPTVESVVSGLSGGNQQKVVLAKWLAMEPQCLVFDEPTRGIDVGARAEIYARMRELADRGVSLLMVTSDMEEVLAMSDRVLVMHEGRLVGELPGAGATEEAVMAMAVGRG